MEEDPNKLTQFAPPSTDAKSSQSFFSRIFGKATGTVPGSSPVAYTPAACTPVARNKVSVKVSGRESPSLFREHSFDGAESTSTSTNKKRVVRNELRTFTNVLGRLMNILDKKPSFSEGLKPYKDSEFRQSWMPDSSCKECYDCGNQFTTFLRRHHCRICGQIFCNSCCNQEVPGRVIGFEGGLRACTYCCGVVSGLMEDSDDLGTLRDNVKAQLSDSTPSITELRGNGSTSTFFPTRKFSTSDSFELPSTRIASVFDLAPTAEPVVDMTLEERQSLVKDSLQLKSLFFEMLDPVDGVQLTTKRHRLRVYHDCFHGNELVNWLTDNDKAQDSHQAVIIGQALLDAKYVLCLTDSDISTYFADYTLYQFREPTHDEYRIKDLGTRRLSAYPEIIEEGPNWIQELEQSEFQVELSSDFAQSYMRSISTLTSEAPYITKRTTMDSGYDIDSKTNITPSQFSHETRRDSSEQIQSTRDELHIPLGNADVLLSSSSLAEQNADVGDQQTLIHNQFRALYKEHITALCIQLLEKSKVSLEWTDILMDLSTNISHFVKPDVCLNKDQMDIAPYVHIKKVRSGIPSDTAVTYGVICTKSVIHNQMKNCIRSPLIMLLQSSIEYQRVTNKLSSLDPQILQEKEYLQNCVARISKYRPDILLVESTVSQVAQQLLLEAGITVVLNVKQAVMHRVARMTMADLIPSIDSLINPPRLGTCYMFQTDVYRFHDGYYKTLMQFNGCPANLGCTVVLRGQNFPELIKVKPILMIMIKACYHFKLEISYLVDQSATPSADVAYKSRRKHASGESRDSVEAVRMSDSPNLSSSPHGSDHFPDAVTKHKRFDTFRQALNTVILDYSPVVQVHLPFFETERGRLCTLRHLFPSHPYCSALLTGQGEPDEKAEMRSHGTNEMYDYRMDKKIMQTVASTELKDPHQFVTWGINCTASDKRLKDLITKFRASGSRLSVNSATFDRNGTFSDCADAANQNQVIDCLDINYHQGISVLFSSCTPDTGPHACVKPWIVHMCFYGAKDIPLGQFLDLYCFRPDYKCGHLECEVPMLDHIRRFVHRSSCLYLIIRKLPESSTESNDPGQTAESNTVTWRYCKRCKKGTPVVPLSPSTWHLSFARFLQIQFDGTLTGSQAIADCVHSMSRDYQHHFQFNDIVAIFKPTSITIRDVTFPPPQVHLEHKTCKNSIASKIKILHTHGLGFFSDIMELIYKLEGNISENEGKQKAVNYIKSDLEIEKKWYTGEVDRLTLLEANIDSSEAGVSEYTALQKLDDDIIRLQCHLSRSVQQWNVKIDSVNGKDDKGNEKKRGEGRSPKNPIPRVAQTIHEDESVASSSETLQSTAVYAGTVNTPISSQDPDGPVLSAADLLENIIAKGSPSSFDSANGLLPLGMSAEYNLGHYHHSVTQGLRAGVGRTRPLTSTDSVGSFVVCDIPDEKPSNQQQIAANSPAESPHSQPVIVGSDIPHPQSSVIVGSDISHPQSSVIVGNDIPHPQIPQSSVMIPLSESDMASSLVESVPLYVSQTEQMTAPIQIIPQIPSTLQQTQTVSSSPQIAAACTPPVLDKLELTNGSLKESRVRPDVIATSEPVGDLHFLSDIDMDYIEDKESRQGNSEEEDMISSSAKDSKIFHQHVSRSSGASDATDVSQHRLRKPKLLKKTGSRYLIESVKIAIMPVQDDATTIAPIDNPFSDNEHFLLNPTLTVPVIIYDEEPSSIIAYALGSRAYEDELTENGKKKVQIPEPAPKSQGALSLPERDCQTDEIEAILKLTSVSAISDSFRAIKTDAVTNSGHQVQLDSDIDDADPSRFGKSKEPMAANPHIEMEFTERSVAGEKMGLFYCKVYFASDFKKLRKLIFPEGEDQFIRSLSRCYKWNAKGGKSGLGFCKTKDDRFIMKQMVKQEIQSFMDFGPFYFDYVTNSLTATDLPMHKCALAKILGVYKIGLKNFVTNAVFRQDVLIIENLFYNRRIHKVFDLKGSARNRLTKKETAQDSVLLDENFIKYSKQSPVYVRDHARKVLMTSLIEDSQFLARHTVMDYSLLCGYDEDTKELVIGIIDYIRTFTWDKKLETVVKSSGFLGGQGKMPTIVSPEVYRTRFLEAMERYFNVVPDRWTNFL